MKSLICTEPGILDYSERDYPEKVPGNSIIKIRKVGICGTDIHAYEGTQPYFSYPRILGHEVAAEYIEGDAEGFQKGDRCSFIPYLHCGNCIACRSGRTNCCSQLKVCGIHIDGAMTEYYSLPSHLLVHGGRLKDDELALVEPLSIAYHGVKRADINRNEFVLIMGAGPIGLGLIAFAKLEGAIVLVIDVRDDRLEFSKKVFSADHLINPARQNAIEEIRIITWNEMCNVVIDATGNLVAINDGINYMAHGGRYCLVGLQKESFSFSHPEFHKREATLMSSRNAVKSDFLEVMRLIEDKVIDPSLFITHRFGFNEVKDRFASLVDPENKVVKAVIEL